MGFLRALACGAVSAMAGLACGCSGHDSGDGASPPSAPDGAADAAAPALDDEGACPAGTQPRADGTCRAAGAANACGEGFQSDGDIGCAAVLPPSECGRGLVAFPGEASCHPVAPCGEGPWGDVVTAADTQFVDGTYAGGDSDGSRSKPWRSIRSAVAAASPGATVAVAAGTYTELVPIVAKPVTIWGKCPAEVELRASSTAPVAIAVRGAGGVVLRGFALTSPSAGVIVSGSADAALRDVWFHDTSDWPVIVADSWGPADLTITNALFESASALAAISALGARLTLDHVAVRDVTSPDPTQGGRGVEIDPGAFGTISELTMRSCVVERVTDVGVFLEGGVGHISSSLFRDLAGRGIELQIDDGTVAPGVRTRAMAEVRGSVVERALGVGVAAFGSDLFAEGLTVRSTRPAKDKTLGRGLQLQQDLSTGARTTADVRWSLVDASVEDGVSIEGADAIFEGVAVRDTSTRADGRFGVGISVERDVDAPAGAPDRSTLSLVDSRVEKSHLVGVVVVASDATVDHSIVTDTEPQADGQYGDGIAVMGGPYPAQVALRRSRLERSKRAGLGNFGAHVAIDHTRFACNAIDLDGEPLTDVAYAYDDRGANSCGCDAAAGSCAVSTSNIQPPGALR